MTPFPSAVEPAMSTQSTWRGDRSGGLLESFPRQRRHRPYRPCRATTRPSTASPEADCRLPLLSYSDSCAPTPTDGRRETIEQHRIRWARTACVSAWLWFDSSTTRPPRPAVLLLSGPRQPQRPLLRLAQLIAATRPPPARAAPPTGGIRRPDADPSRAPLRTGASADRQAAPPAPRLRPSRLVPPRECH